MYGAGTRDRELSILMHKEVISDNVLMSLSDTVLVAGSVHSPVLFCLAVSETAHCELVYTNQTSIHAPLKCVHT